MQICQDGKGAQIETFLIGSTCAPIGMQSWLLSL